MLEKTAQTYGELHNLSSSPNNLGVNRRRRVTWTRHGRDENCRQDLFGKPEVKRLLRRLKRRRWTIILKRFLKKLRKRG
jgi:hypothetical protein